MMIATLRRTLCVLSIAVPLACTRATGVVPVSADAAVGAYQLVSIAWSAESPYAALPAWTFPGRALVLEGQLVLSEEGRLVRYTRGRLSLFGDTTFTAVTDTGSWTVRGDTILLQFAPNNPPEPALLQARVLTTFAGGVASGGTRMRYRRN